MSDSTWALRLLTKLLTPKQRLSVSQWADAYRQLSAKSSSEPGPWRTDRTPYLREIMDVLSVDSPVSRVVVMKSAQMGMTEAAGNWIGYIMGHVRTAKPTLIVVPTDRLLVRWVHQRLRPMIEGASDLASLLAVTKSRDGTNRLDMLDYPGGILNLTTAGSASNLKSDSICYVICDEADEYAWDVGGRGDPLGMIESRQSNFPRRKLLIFSTPTVKGTSRIEAEYEASDQRRYHVRCPHCGEMQVLEWEHLHWNTDLSQVWYTCAATGCTILERDKPKLLARNNGFWVPTYPDRSIRGYHISALYAPLGLGYSWTELAGQWLNATDNDELKQNFINERLGLPWEDKRTNVKTTDLESRAEPYGLRIVQPGGLLITAGVDTQDDRLAVQLVAWGKDGRWWVLDYVELPGDPARAEVWFALTALLQRPLDTEAGTVMWVEGMAIDMAGHHTEAVKNYIRTADLQRAIAVQGSNHRLNVVLSKPRPIDCTPRGTTFKYGMKFYQVGTELGKDRVYADIRTDSDHPPADRKAHFSQDLPPEYYAGLLSEAWNPKKNRYEPRRGMTKRNEPLDTWVYAYAAAHHPELRLDRMRPIDWKNRAARWWPDDPTAPRPKVAPPVEPPPRAIPPVPPPKARPPRAGSNFVGGWRR